MDRERVKQNMMVTRSPSPITARVQSPKARTPDPTPTAKKNPWINPLGSPRHSIQERDSGARVRTVSTASKENDTRGRSPVVPPLKGAKNFMIPTISASSKRRVLSERNDWMRSSMTSSVTDSMDSISSFDLESKSRVGYDSEDDLDRARITEWEDEIARPPISHSPAADESSLPPYDPETNYLSPRPRFLRYRPKSRIELDDTKTLEGSFLSESCDDESPQRSGDAQSSLTHKGLDQEDHQEDEERIDTPAMVEAEETVTDKITACSSDISESRSSFRTKFTVLLLLGTIACFCITTSDSPIIPSPHSSPKWELPSSYIRPFGAMKDMNSKGYSEEAMKFGDRDLGELARVLRQWSADVFARFSGSNSVPTQEDLGWFYHTNLTSVVDDVDLVTESADMVVPYEFEMGEVGSTSMQPQINEQIRKELVAGDQIMGDRIIVDAEDRSHQENENEVCAMLASGEIAKELEIDDENVETNEVVDCSENESTTSITVTLVSDSEGNAHAVNFESIVGIESSDAEPVTYLEEHECVVGSSIKLAETPPVVDIEEKLSGISPKPLAYFGEPYQIMLAISLLVMAITAKLIFQYIKSGRPSHLLSNAQMTRQPPPSNHRALDDPCSNMQFQAQVKSNHPTETETVHTIEGPSARGGKTPKKMEEEEEVIRKQRRDSTASSSTSYGSFTTYEKKLSGKKGVQDEVVTPVRRSSRIRSQVTSP